MSRGAEELVNKTWTGRRSCDVYTDFNDLTLRIVTDVLFGFQTSSPDSREVTSELPNQEASWYPGQRCNKQRHVGSQSESHSFRLAMKVPPGGGKTASDKCKGSVPYRFCASQTDGLVGCQCVIECLHKHLTRSLGGRSCCEACDGVLRQPRRLGLCGPRVAADARQRAVQRSCVSPRRHSVPHHCAEALWGGSNDWRPEGDQRTLLSGRSLFMQGVLVHYSGLRRLFVRLFQAERGCHGSTFVL